VLGSATVTRNVLTGCGVGLDLDPTNADAQRATTFGARVSLNDVLTPIGVRVVNDYSLPTELSASMRGNHWGATCGASVAALNGQTTVTHVTDRFPYDVPVADRPESLLPTPCR
jgi:hypothetical protein